MVMDLIKVVNTLLDQCTYTRITQDPETFYAMLTHSIFLQYDRTQNYYNSLYYSVPTGDFFFFFQVQFCLLVPVNQRLKRFSITIMCVICIELNSL